MQSDVKETVAIYDLDRIDIRVGEMLRVEDVAKSGKPKGARAC